MELYETIGSIFEPQDYSDSKFCNEGDTEQVQHVSIYVDEDCNEELCEVVYSVEGDIDLEDITSKTQITLISVKSVSTDKEIIDAGAREQAIDELRKGY